MLAVTAYGSLIARCSVPIPANTKNTQECDNSWVQGARRRGLESSSKVRLVDKVNLVPFEVIKTSLW